MKEHYFISECDGALHDTRQVGWSSQPLRENYAKHHRNVKSLADVKACLRAGPYAWPGGYPLFFITKDGEALSFEGARQEFRQIVQDYLWNYNTGWKIAGVDINYEDNECYCAVTGEQIKPCYIPDD